MHSTMANNGTQWTQWTQYQAYAAVFGSVMALGLPLNAVSLWILLRRHNLKSPSAVFMVNLAISDLLLIISLPMRVYFYATNSWPLGEMACIWITMLFRNNIRSSSIFITFISVDRLLAVVYPLRSRHLRTSSNASKAAALIWLFVLVWNIPEGYYFSKFLKIDDNKTCFEFDRYENSVLSYFQPVVVFIMLGTNVVCTVLVFRTLNTYLKDSARVSNKVNVMLIFAMNLVMFAIFFLPVSLVGILNDRRQTTLKCLASVNCCMDPLLYYFSFDGFWKSKEDMDTS